MKEKRKGKADLGFICFAVFLCIVVAICYRLERNSGPVQGDDFALLRKVIAEGRIATVDDCTIYRLPNGLCFLSAHKAGPYAVSFANGLKALADQGEEVYFPNFPINKLPSNYMVVWTATKKSEQEEP